MPSSSVLLLQRGVLTLSEPLSMEYIRKERAGSSITIKAVRSHRSVYRFVRDAIHISLLIEGGEELPFIELDAGEKRVVVAAIRKTLILKKMEEAIGEGASVILREPEEVEVCRSGVPGYEYIRNVTRADGCLMGMTTSGNSVTLSSLTLEEVREIEGKVKNSLIVVS